MRTLALAVVLALTVASIAWAWQYEDEFPLNQVGFRPGGGGLYGTGSKQDARITCSMCHVLPDGGFGGNRISAGWSFTPALPAAPDGGFGYAAGQSYLVDLTMNNAHLGFLPDGGSGHHNMMAATFENAAGQFVGALASDTGFSTNGNCPATLTAANWNAYDAGSTTVTQGNCHTITGRTEGVNGNFKRLWHFRWTAPQAGAGRVYLYWGMTNGDGDEKTIGDDSIQGLTVLEQQ